MLQIYISTNIITFDIMVCNSVSVFNSRFKMNLRMIVRRIGNVIYRIIIFTMFFFRQVQFKQLQ